MPIVSMPNGDQVSFPDEMPKDQIKSLILKKFPDAHTTAKSSPKSTEQPSLMERVGSDVQGRLDAAKNAPDLANFMISSARIVPGTISDTMGEIIEPVAKPVMEATGVSGLLQELAQSSAGMKTNEFLKAHPTVANALGLGMDYAGALTGGEVPATTGSVVKNVALKSMRKNRIKAISDAILPDVSTISGREAAIQGGGVGVKKTLVGKGNAYAIPSKMEEESIKHVADIKEFNPKNLHIENANIIHGEIQKEASRIKNILYKENTSLLETKPTEYPTHMDEFGSVVHDAPIVHKEVNRFHEVLDRAISELSDNTTLSGNARSKAIEIAEKMKEFVNKNPQTTAGLLQARKDFDQWIKASRAGQKAFEPDVENGLSAATRTVRQTTNKFIAENTKNADVRASLSKQSALYRAKDVLEEKAKKQAFTRSERAGKLISKGAAIKAGAGTAAAAAAGAAAAIGLGK